VPESGKLVGRNTDVDGVAAALCDAPVKGAKAVLIGGGGGARAAFQYLQEDGARHIALLVRDRARAACFAGRDRVDIHALDECDEALAGASIIINASPLGMLGSPPMPPHLLDRVAAHARGATLFDMVYAPLRTAFLEAGTTNGGTVVDGLTMLIGQARTAFEHFFGCPPPPGDSALRDLLVP